MRPSVFKKQVDNVKNYLLANDVIIRNIVEFSNDDNYSIIYCSYLHNRFKVIISQYDDDTFSVFCIFPFPFSVYLMEQMNIIHITLIVILVYLLWMCLQVMS